MEQIEGLIQVGSIRNALTGQQVPMYELKPNFINTVAGQRLCAQYGHKSKQYRDAKAAWNRQRKWYDKAKGGASNG